VPETGHTSACKGFSPFSKILRPSFGLDVSSILENSVVYTQHSSGSDFLCAQLRRMASGKTDQSVICAVKNGGKRSI
jgi:hypothetical protein